jgi:mono/diheme cytochrome c family protein
VRFLILAGALGLGVLVAGCDSSGYPEHLRYPERADLLVKGAKAIDIRKPLPPPGHIEENIVEAATGPKGKEYFEAVVNPKEASAEFRKELQQTLREIFGTPARPTIEPTASKSASEEAQAAVEENKKVYDKALAEGLDNFGAKPEDVDTLQLDDRTLRKGSELYRRHCLHCHGVVGDGRGPTGPWVHPHPRDYRQGLFKFISTALDVKGVRRPRREDLLRTLSKGIDGTSMPSFGVLPQKELEQLASYVIHLSVRGQVEYESLWAAVKAEATVNEVGMKAFAYQKTGEVLAQWAASNAKGPTAPPAYPLDDNDKAAVQASIRRGHQLFLGKAICITCHFDYGRQSAYRYDEWGTLVRPRNLTEGAYRGGRRPIDLFWRVSGGIIPSNMSQLPAGMTDQEVWDLINFVQHLPYPAMLPEDVRDKVYGPAEPGKKAHVARVGHP